MKIGVYVCECGVNIAATVDVEKVVVHAKSLPNVAVSRFYRYMCSDPGQELIKKDIKELKHIAESDIPTITYNKALDIINDKDDMNIQWGKDLRTIEQNKLMNHFNTPIVVTNYPLEIMAFYKPKDPDNPKTALCFDMIAPGEYGEIIGGSQRSLDIEEMKKNLRDAGENIKNYKWYFDLSKYGSVPHSGYGLGVERVVAWICGIENIKDAIPFPRTVLRFRP